MTTTEIQGQTLVQKPRKQRRSKSETGPRQEVEDAIARAQGVANGTVEGVGSAPMPTENPEAKKLKPVYASIVKALEDLIESGLPSAKEAPDLHAGMDAIVKAVDKWQTVIAQGSENAVREYATNLGLGDVFFERPEPVREFPNAPSVKRAKKAKKASGGGRQRAASGTLEERAKEMATYVKAHDGCKRADIQKALKWSDSAYSTAAKKAKDLGLVKMKGDRKLATWHAK